MENVRLGKTELQVSEVGFGGIPIVPLTFDDAVSVVRHCFDLGMTLFDTAKLYRDSEEKIGKALERVRDQVVLATKTMARDAKKARHDIESSLSNLRTASIDLYQLHNVSDAKALEQVLGEGGACEALAEARAAGKIRSIGVTSHNIEAALQACRTARFETLQFPFNFVEREPADELFRVAGEMDMGIIAMKPLGGGWLESARLCFGFLQQHPDVVPIPGMAKREEADEIVGFYRSRIALTPSDLDAMERIRDELGSKFCHRCEYCMPCEQGVQIPFALGFRSFAKRFGREAALKLTRTAMEGAANCTECGECLEKCPYELQIPALLKENLALYRDLKHRGGEGLASR